MLGKLSVHWQMDSLLICQSMTCIDAMTLFFGHYAIGTRCVVEFLEVRVLPVHFTARHIFDPNRSNQRIRLEEASIRLIATLANCISQHLCNIC